MKKILFILLFCPCFSNAQQTLPRFENDTLYTTGGYKIYKGQTLHFANGTSAAGYFRFIKFHYSMARTDTYTLQNGTVLVSKLKNYKNSGSDNQSIRISGTATYKDGRQAEVDFFIEFEKAIDGTGGQPAELTVPEEFKNRRPETIAVPAEVKKQNTAVETKKTTAPADIKNLLVADEIKKLFDLYKAGALTKEEYEAQKKKLLERQWP